MNLTSQKLLTIIIVKINKIDFNNLLPQKLRMMIYQKNLKMKKKMKRKRKKNLVKVPLLQIERIKNQGKNNNIM
jgi:hypothetical protein